MQSNARSVACILHCLLEEEWHMATARDLDYAETRGSGWIAFAGVMMMIAGSITFVQGLWALDHKHNAAAKAAATQISYANLNTWGWILVIWGTILFFSGIAIFGHSQFARWVGIFAASVSLILSFFWVFAYPLAAFSIMFIDILVLYALIAYGGRYPEID